MTEDEGDGMSWCRSRSSPMMGGIGDSVLRVESQRDREKKRNGENVEEQRHRGAEGRGERGEREKYKDKDSRWSTRTHDLDHMSHGST